MNSIVKIDNQMMSIIKEPAFYKLCVQVYGVCDCVLRAERYVYNTKMYYGKKLRTYLNNQLKKFQKLLDDNCYWSLSEDTDYNFDEDYRYEEVIQDDFNNKVNIVLTPAKETFDIFMENEIVCQFIKDR